jgi:hypothetical protein
MLQLPDSEARRVELYEVFRRLQARMLADMALGRMFEHGPSRGTATENNWIDILHAYLPARYRAAPAFIVNSDGEVSEQIDIAVYDHLSAPPILSHMTAMHLAIESVGAVFEVKPAFSRAALDAAADKLYSVRKLSAAKRPMLGGILATGSQWAPESFSRTLERELDGLSTSERLTLGCCLERGAFDNTGAEMIVSRRDQALGHFLLRLIHHLGELPPSPMNLLAYLEGI